MRVPQATLHKVNIFMPEKKTPITALDAQFKYVYCIYLYFILLENITMCAVCPCEKVICHYIFMPEIKIPMTALNAQFEPISILLEKSLCVCKELIITSLHSYA